MTYGVTPWKHRMYRNTNQVFRNNCKLVNMETDVWLNQKIVNMETCMWFIASVSQIYSGYIMYVN